MLGDSKPGGRGDARASRGGKLNIALKGAPKRAAAEFSSEPKTSQPERGLVLAVMPARRQEKTYKRKRGRAEQK